MTVWSHATYGEKVYSHIISRLTPELEARARLGGCKVLTARLLSTQSPHYSLKLTFLDGEEVEVGEVKHPGWAIQVAARRLGLEWIKEDMDVRTTWFHRDKPEDAYYCDSNTFWTGMENVAEGEKGVL
jgi:hypothetical protein